jgi:hypothetical protein
LIYLSWDYKIEACQTDFSLSNIGGIGNRYVWAVCVNNIGTLNQAHLRKKKTIYFHVIKTPVVIHIQAWVSSLDPSSGRISPFAIVNMLETPFSLYLPRKIPGFILNCEGYSVVFDKDWVTCFSLKLDKESSHLNQN